MVRIRKTKETKSIRWQARSIDIGLKSKGRVYKVRVAGGKRPTGRYPSVCRGPGRRPNPVNPRFVPARRNVLANEPMLHSSRIVSRGRLIGSTHPRSRPGLPDEARLWVERAVSEKEKGDIFSASQMKARCPGITVLCEICRRRFRSMTQSERP